MIFTVKHCHGKINLAVKWVHIAKKQHQDQHLTYVLLNAHLTLFIKLYRTLILIPHILLAKQILI